MKLTIQEAMIEVTRRCNMSCSHCLRGEAESLDISDEYLKLFFSRISYISTLVITGGEPSIAVDRIKAVIRHIKHYKVGLGSFYLVTNGKVVSNKFLMAVMELYGLCDDWEAGIGGLAWSSDQFHEDIPRQNIEKLKVFRFAEPKGEIKERYIIYEGRGQDFGNDKHPSMDSYGLDLDNTIAEGNVYLNCEDNIIAGCDWSYESQREPEKIVCHVKDLSIQAFENFMQRREVYEEAV